MCWSPTPIKGPLRAYARWIVERYLEAATYLELGVKVKERHDALVREGKLPGPIVTPKEPYADVAGIMAVQWKKEEPAAHDDHFHSGANCGRCEEPSKVAQFKAAL